VLFITGVRPFLFGRDDLMRSLAPLPYMAPSFNK
jgi:hypothetical protein